MEKSRIIELIEDCRNRVITSTERELSLHKLPHRANIVIGLRRSGKSTFLRQQLQNLLKLGVPLKEILYVNLEDDRLNVTSVQNLRVVYETFIAHGQIPHERKKFVFFDEIQVVNEWEKFIRTLIDTENIEIFLSGSSAKMLSKEIATNMRGRSVDTEFFPFSFQEYLSHIGQNFADLKKPSAHNRLLLEGYFQKFIEGSALPELVLCNEEVQLKALKDFLDVIIYRDVVERYQISATFALRQLVKQIMSNVSSLFSISKFHGDLKSRGVAIGKETLYELVLHLEDAYAIFTVAEFSTSEREKQTRVKKVYAGDLGFSKIFSGTANVNRGARLENAVFLQIRRHCSEIYYLKNETHTEVDFYFNYKNQEYLVQVCLTLQDESTLKREKRALVQAQKRFPNSKCFIITESEKTTLLEEDVNIEVVPAWEWCFMREIGV